MRAGSPKQLLFAIREGDLPGISTLDNLRTLDYSLITDIDMKPTQF